MNQSAERTSEVMQRSDLFERMAMGGPGLTVVLGAGNNNVLFVNSRFESHTGFFLNDIANTPFVDLLDDPEKERFAQQMRALADLPHGFQGFVVYRIRNKRGVCTQYYMYASNIGRDNEGQWLFKLVLFPDNSEWGMPFTSFSTRELFLEQLYTEDFGTFEWMTTDDRVFWSFGMYRIFEVSFENRNISFGFMEQFLHPRDAQFVKDSISNTLSTGAPLDIEFRVISSEKHEKVLHCIIHKLKDPHSQSPVLAGSVRDVTAQRAMESDLKKKVEELHRSNRELEEFAYAASHDMLEPLRKITTFSDRLAEKYKFALSGEGEMYLSRMINSAENMRMLINGLLELSKVTKAVAPFENVDLNVVAQMVITDLELKVEETGTIIRYYGLPEVEAVLSLMKQLFTNLIGNAIKFHKPGTPPIIRIDTVPATADEVQKYGLNPKRKYHKISVTDNGIGFEDEYAARIFQVFQRLHGKSEYPGSGIGLAICKKIVEYHHGIIFAQNVEGVGASFVFILPERQ